MKLKSLLVLFLAFICTHFQLLAQMTHVKDEAKMLSREEARSLDERLKAYDAQSATQIGVLIVNSLDGKTEKEVANEWGRKIGVGQKGEDNGVVILIAKQERKIRIEVGYGLEGLISDATSKRIINEKITPAFRQSQYAKGLNEAVDELILLANKEKFERTKPLEADSKVNANQTEFWSFGRVLAYILSLFVIWRLIAVNTPISLYACIPILGLWTLAEIFLIYKQLPDFSSYLFLFGGYLVMFFAFQSQINLKNKATKIGIKLKLKLSKLEELKQTYYPEKLDDFIHQIHFETSNRIPNLTALESLSKSVDKIINEPDRNLKKRIDIFLKDFAVKIDSLNYFPEHQKYFEILIQKELAYFENNPSLATDEMKIQQIFIFLSQATEEGANFLSIYKKTKNILTNEQFWNTLQKTHYPKNEIKSKKELLEQNFRQTSIVESLENLEKVSKEINAIYDNPDDHFNKRNDAALILLSENPDWIDLMSNPVYTEFYRNKAQEKLNEALSYFSAISLKPLNQTDAQRLEDDLIYFNDILRSPEVVLKYDKDWLRNQVDAFMEGLNWQTYVGTYTTQSIERTQYKFDSLYAQLKSYEKNDHDKYLSGLFDFYAQIITKFDSQTHLFLEKIKNKPNSYQQTNYNTYNDGANTYSSTTFITSNYNDYSDTSSYKDYSDTNTYSDYSDYSDTSSSYSDSYSDSSWGGGGDFGGGGASGDW